MQDITAAMCLYNEELLIDLAIRSAIGFADAFVFVDNGCTDRTIEIAHDVVDKYNLNAKFFSFEGQLRSARFFSFQKSRTKWTFLHDGDHILQTEGEHSLLRIKTGLNNAELCYRFPLVRMFHDYHTTQANLLVAPPHKLLYTNKPKRWDIAQGTRNLPDALCNVVSLHKFMGVWNVCIKRPARILERQFWRRWRGDGRPGSCRQYIANLKGFPIEAFEDYAAEYMMNRISDKERHPPLDASVYGGLPTVIREEYDAGVIRCSFDTVETIRQKRANAGLDML